MTGRWRLRGYVVERLLGSGGSSDVWRGRVSATGEPVALKRIAGVDADAVKRAETEAALLTALDHPHLVRLHAFLPTDDATVLVLDLADGGSLAQLLEARGRLTPGEVVTALAPIGAALSYLHDAGVVHGDVSAANVLFTPAGVPLLADVGVARLLGDDSDAHTTPAYVDPCVAAGSVPGAQSDVFMLAAVALHALTGTPPWVAPTGDAALALAAAGVLDDVAARLAAAHVPPAMTQVLARALSVDPHRRGTAAEFALDLRHSVQPVAVELAAGRSRPDPARMVRTAAEGLPDGSPGPAQPAQHGGPRHAALLPQRGRSGSKAGRSRRSTSADEARRAVAALRRRHPPADATGDATAARPPASVRPVDSVPTLGVSEPVVVSGAATKWSDPAVVSGGVTASLAPARPMDEPSDPARPSFERPSLIVPGNGVPPPTRMAGPRPRPTVPARRRGIRHRLRAHAVVICVVAACAVLLAAAGTVWASTRDEQAARGPGGRTVSTASGARAAATPSAPSHTTTRTASVPPSNSNSTGASSPVEPAATLGRHPATSRSSTTNERPTAAPRPATVGRAKEAAPTTAAAPTSETRSTSVAGPTSAAEGSSAAGSAGARTRRSAEAVWVQALNRLDAVRSTAFATRDPRLLDQVYVPGPLMTADTELLTRIVPVGCTLLGARTTFTGVQVVTGNDSATITATATLAPSTLLCDGHRRGTALGAGPARLRLVLRRTRHDVRISDERTV